MRAIDTRPGPTRQGDPLGGGKRRQLQSELLVTCVTGTNAGGTALFDVEIPSPRLSVGVSVTFVPDNAEDVAFPTGANAWTLQLDAWVRLSNEVGGNLTRANQIMPASPLPTMWEVESTTVRKWRGTVVVPTSSGMATGRLYVTATWEPAPGESRMTDEELQAIFGACYVTPLLGVVTSPTA